MNFRDDFVMISQGSRHWVGVLEKASSVAGEGRLIPELEMDGAHMRAFAELPLHISFRAGELLSRRYGHISGGDASVLIDQTKTGRDRRVPLNSRALAILKDRRHGAGYEELIFDPQRMGRSRRRCSTASRRRRRGPGSRTPPLGWRSQRKREERGVSPVLPASHNPVGVCAACDRRSRFGGAGAGADAYVLKPEIGRLLAAVRHLLQHSRAVKNEL